ncbi:aminodeoxychorismate synthase component I [Shewanella intestini]|uniref:aminodeoxychorismate synthase n=1 Tax=Shewanella intestini TaxID=2017544 RepID=A0ABS5I6L4_9GAMM|nr:MULTISPECIES: aminodeoxychorismate synthase component I [Shewanella]MBR9729010.1 aminodeoxychorismate synthase component I [Shewanella intestini]MRG36924.1 aminodeoxychorismate synthase component I [Shewanella sp. XMDDZSB0408]
MSLRLHSSLASVQLDWKVDTHTLFSHFAHTPWAMLLDSANTQHIDARVDIIAINPIATLTACAENYQLTITANSPLNTPKNRPSLTQLQQQIKQQGNAFDALSCAQQALYPHVHETNLPFTGGALGAFNYDLGRQLEVLPTKANNDIGLNELNIGFYDFVLMFDYQQQTWTASHYLGEDALLQHLDAIEAQVFTPASTHAPRHVTPPPEQSRFNLTSPWHNQLSQAQYVDKFAQIQAYLLSGDCYQINLTQRFDAQYQGDEWQAYCQLSQVNKAPFSAFVRLEKHCILSISPERFIQVNQQQVQTKPIKGTLPRGTTQAHDALLAQRLKESEKDRAENLMIVDLLRNDLSRIAAPGSVKVPKLFEIESFPAVHHLVSTVTATLADDKNSIDVLKATFPGGSITGAPKIRAMEIIEELEPSRRSIYCGSIGYISQNGHMDTSITIRTLVTDNKRIYCWAGGGIVADSQAQAEYQESFDKVCKILPVLTAS